MRLSPFFVPFSFISNVAGIWYVTQPTGSIFLTACIMFVMCVLCGHLVIWSFSISETRSLLTIYKYRIFIL